MQLVFVTHAYPRWPGDVAGAFVERLAVALSQRSHTVRVVAPSDEGRGGPETLSGIPISRVRYASAKRETLAYTGKMVEGSRSPLGAVAAVNLMKAQSREVTRLCRETPCEVIHAHWWVPGGVSASWSCRKTRVPYVVTVHGTDVRMLEKSLPIRAAARRVFRRAAAITAVSSYLAERVAWVAGLDPNDIVVQPMPVEVDRFDRVSAGGGGIVSIGRLTKQKNLGIVLEAMARLEREGIRAPLRLIGDGPEHATLAARARSLGLDDRVEFAGAVAPGDVPHAVGDADVSVFTAVAEGFGLGAAESLMLGVPVVALKTGGGVTDVVPESGAGRLVPPDDPAALAQAIAELLRDDTGRRLAAETGRALKERFAPQAVAQAFESVYAHARAAAG